MTPRNFLGKVLLSIDQPGDHQMLMLTPSNLTEQIRMVSVLIWMT